MNNPLVKQILGAVVLAVGAAVFAGVFGSFLYAPAGEQTVAYKLPAGDSNGGDDAAAAAKPAGPEPILAMLADADLAGGAKIAKKKCAACHTFDEGGKNKTGPNLFGVVGRGKAANGDFKYSGAMQEFGGDWSYDDLNNFLYKPKAFINGTKMGFAGLKKVDDRAEVIAYLRSLSADPLPLP